MKMQAIQNYEAVLAQIARRYKAHMHHKYWLAEGLQKDAIQNSWDARLDKENGEGWACDISLKSIAGQKYVCIADKGTTGLRGRRFNDDLERTEVLKLVDRGDRKQNLACFLNPYWQSKEGSEQAGEFGQGKSIFMCASKDKKIFFESCVRAEDTDSSSSDNQYIFGEVYIADNKGLEFEVYYDDVAKGQFRKQFDASIEPYEQIGTRIFITNPEPSVMEAIKDLSILRLISLSWWELIRDCNAEITVTNESTGEKADLPYGYEADSKAFREDMLREQYGGRLGKRGANWNYEYKLNLRYSPTWKIGDEMSASDQRGVAIQRAKMTIERRETKLIDDERVKDIFGWLTMGSELEKEIKANCEGDEHAHLNWKPPVTAKIADVIDNHIRDFAQKHGIIPTEGEAESNKQLKAARRATDNLLPLARKLNLGSGKGRRRGTRKATVRKPNLPLRLSAKDFKILDSNNQVNYGDKLIGAYAMPINEYDKTFNVSVRVGLVRRGDLPTILEEREIQLPPTGPADESEKIGPGEIVMEAKYPPGRYSWFVEMLSLEDGLSVNDCERPYQSGATIYRTSRPFYLNTEPPHGGGAPYRFDEDKSRDTGFLFRLEDNGDDDAEYRYTIYYNSNHPKIKDITEKSEKDLEDFLTENGALSIIQIKIREILRGEVEEGDDSDLVMLVRKNDTEGIYKKVLEIQSEFLWDFTSKISL